MMLEESLNELSDLFADDARLQALIDTLRPHVDFFAPDESAERTESILALRYWIGEHYRLFHRLLRNRREDPSLICLFLDWTVWKKSPGRSAPNRSRWMKSLKPTARLLCATLNVIGI
jgi:hypothetical protein